MEDISTYSSDTSGWKRAFYGCLITGLVLLVVAILAIVFGAKQFVKYGISSDITEYISIVEKSDLDADRKQDLQHRFERIRDRARQGQLVGFWVWLDYDESISNLIDDGTITESDLAALTRELDRLEHTR